MTKESDLRALRERKSARGKNSRGSTEGRAARLVSGMAKGAQREASDRVAAKGPCLSARETHPVAYGPTAGVEPGPREAKSQAARPHAKDAASKGIASPQPDSGVSGLDLPRSRSRVPLATSQAAGAGSKVKRPRGRPRIEDRDKTNIATKPWDLLGMSQRSWYRRQKENR